MKIKAGAMFLIASLGLFVVFAFAQQGTGRQRDRAMQQTDPGSRQRMSPQTLKEDQQTVKQVQQALIAHGYDAGPADGTWRSNTEISLKLYQQEQGMEATGQLDQMTLAALGFPGGAAAGGRQGGSGY